ncbi:Hypothetical_protein [Hexamita inflata]|uniref:Hypothetical_protein n=1 Tax=Hexamita inflata TaxID=28002 RepID=A0AA86VKK6_9EUKA|nr:Hypothetical protein HINF_LOCUS56958 [Hexamita inflata]
MINKKPTTILSYQKSRTALSHVTPPHRLSVSSFGLMKFGNIYLIVKYDTANMKLFQFTQQFIHIQQKFILKPKYQIVKGQRMILYILCNLQLQLFKNRQHLTQKSSQQRGKFKYKSFKVMTLINNKYDDARRRVLSLPLYISERRLQQYMQSVQKQKWLFQLNRLNLFQVPK